MEISLILNKMFKSFFFKIIFLFLVKSEVLLIRPPIVLVESDFNSEQVSFALKKAF